MARLARAFQRMALRVRELEKGTTFDDSVDH